MSARDGARSGTSWLPSGAASALAVVAWVVTVGYTAAIVSFGVRTGCFWGDDLSTFRHSLERPFRELALIPLGSQIVPVHRAVTVAVYRLAPFVWPAAVAVLAFFHVAALWLLYRTLHLLRSSRANALLVTACATHVVAGFQLTWFSSGLTRAPYVLLSLVAIHAYLSLSRRPSRWHVPVMVLATVLAFGFYTKAVLIPLYCVAFDLAARGRESLTDRRVRLPLLALVLADAFTYLVVRSQQDWVARTMNLDFGQQIPFMTTSLSVVSHGLVGIVQEYGHYQPRLWALLVVPALALYAVLRAPSTWRAALVGFSLVAVNLAVVGTSNRTIMFRGFMPFEHRHFHELCFLVVLAGGIAVHSLLDRAPELRWLRSGPAANGAAALLSVALVAFAVHSYRTFAEVAPRVSSPQTCRFFGTLRSELARIPRVPSPTFVDWGFPRHLVGLDLSFWRYSQLFPVLGFEARFSPEGQYRVLDSGHVVPSTQVPQDR